MQRRVSDAGVSLVLVGSGREEAWRRLYEGSLPLHGSTPDCLAGREPPHYETWRSGVFRALAGPGRPPQRDDGRHDDGLCP